MIADVFAISLFPGALRPPVCARQRGHANWEPPGIFTDANEHMVSTRPDWLPASDPFGAKMRNFVDHVHHGKPTMAPAEHGLMVQKMLDGIYESAAKGHEVRIK